MYKPLLLLTRSKRWFTLWEIYLTPQMVGWSNGVSGWFSAHLHTNRQSTVIIFFFKDDCSAKDLLILVHCYQVKYKIS